MRKTNNNQTGLYAALDIFRSQHTHRSDTDLQSGQNQIRAEHPDRTWPWPWQSFIS